jgi:membrane protein involved in colicin uptake
MGATTKTPEEKAKEAEAKAAAKAAEAKAAQEAAEKAAKEAEEKAAEEKAAKKDAVFAKNPQLDIYYRTSDGLPFFTKNAADMHAAGLENKTVKKVTK